MFSAIRRRTSEFYEKNVFWRQQSNASEDSILTQSGKVSPSFAKSSNASRRNVWERSSTNQNAPLIHHYERHYHQLVIGALLMLTTVYDIVSIVASVLSLSLGTTAIVVSGWKKWTTVELTVSIFALIVPTVSTMKVMGYDLYFTSRFLRFISHGDLPMTTLDRAFSVWRKWSCVVLCQLTFVLVGLLVLVQIMRVDTRRLGIMETPSFFIAHILATRIVVNCFIMENYRRSSGITVLCSTLAYDRLPIIKVIACVDMIINVNSILILIYQLIDGISVLCVHSTGFRGNWMPNFHGVNSMYFCKILVGVVFAPFFGFTLWTARQLLNMTYLMKPSKTAPKKVRLWQAFSGIRVIVEPAVSFSVFMQFLPRNNTFFILIPGLVSILLGYRIATIVFVGHFHAALKAWSVSECDSVIIRGTPSAVPEAAPDSTHSSELIPDKGGTPEGDD